MAGDNRKIRELIISGQFLIDEEMGLTALQKYLHDLELVEAGLSLKDLGYTADRLNAISIDEPSGRRFFLGDARIPAGSISRTKIDGVMMMKGGLCSMGIEEVCEELYQLDNDPNIRAHKLIMNTPGGEATAAAEMYNVVKDLKKPSVALVHLSASAGYFGILPAKEIIALSDMSRIGSIGALTSIDKKFAAAYKERYEEIYSSKSPDKNEAQRAYQNNGDSSIIVRELDKLVDIFQAKVVMHRELNPDFKSETLKGKVFTAREAKTRGLIDLIGSETLANKRLQSFINK